MALNKPLLYPYQQKWVNDKSRVKVGMWSRQIGKTFTTTLEIVMEILEAEAKGKASKWVIGSRSERQAKLAMNEGVKVHLKAQKAVFEEREYELESKEKALEVEFPNGSIITIIPASPDTIRGFTRNVYLDEFALHKDSLDIWAAVSPIISSRKDLRIIVTSTPKGKGNKFYEMMTGQDSIWSRHIADIYKAVEDGAPREIEFLRELAGDETIFAQEYECKFIDEASNWLSHDLIMAAESPLAGRFEDYHGGNCFIGNDIARRKDLWVAWVIEQVGDVFITREIVAKSDITFSEQDTIMDDLFNRYKVIKLTMDQTSMGEKPVEDAIRRYGKSRVEGVIFSTQSKLHLANVGKQAFEDRKIRIPAGDNDLRADLYSIKKVIGSSGIPRLIAERENGSHADRAWACFLALYAASSTGGGKFEYSASYSRDADALMGEFNDISPFDIGY